MNTDPERDKRVESYLAGWRQRQGGWLAKTMRVALFQKLRRSLLRAVNAPILKSFIAGKRVLILGSGPSAAVVKAVPDDVLVFTCNAGIVHFAEKNPGRKIDFYLCGGLKFAKKDGEKALERAGARLFVTTDPEDIRQNTALGKSYERLLEYDANGNYYLDRLVRPERFRSRKKPSVGVRLLQYALYFGAREIYVAGIDLDEGGYFWGGKNKQKHAGPDTEFLNIVARRFPNVYALSDKSPLARILQHRTF